MSSSNPLPILELPKRWEFLTQRAAQSGLDPAQFVERVDDAAERVDHLLTRIRATGGGVFEIFFGLSGSGKTTFLQTLPRFFNDIRVTAFHKERPLAELPEFVRSSHVADDVKSRIILIERRDNPSSRDQADAEKMLPELLEVFREPAGAVVVIWPITLEPAVNAIAGAAWRTGRDSVVDSVSRGIYRFSGIPKERYYEIADTTARNLSGDGLEAFGVTQDIAAGILPNCETIADFFNSVDRQADQQRKSTWSILKERVRARLWVALPGDIVSSINSTVSSLTQGTQSRVDIDLIGEFIDQPGNNAIYIKEWRKRRGSLAHLMRALDLRLFGIPPNLALAAVRLFGDDATQALLNQKTVNRDAAKNAMKASRLYKAILREAGIDSEPYAGSREVGEETSNEYRRIQQVASSSDKPLNKALALLIGACLEDDAPGLEVVAEKQSVPGSSLKPDLRIKLAAKDFICIEPTWRSTDEGIQGELEGGQNTLAEAHIKKYVLDKALTYVNDLGI